MESNSVCVVMPHFHAKKLVVTGLEKARVRVSSQRQML